MMTEAELSDRLKSVPSIWLSLEERMCLLKYAGLSKGPIVEIGTAWGGSACILVLGSDRVVNSIDPYEEPLCKVDGWNITSEKVYELVQRVLGDWELNRKRWWQWIRTSAVAAEEYNRVLFHAVRLDENGNNEFGPLGLVFIDGDHSYEAVKQDVSLWLPLIQSRGYLILHDSANRDLMPPDGCQYQGPHQVAAELREDNRVKWLETAYSITAWEVL